MLEKLAKYDIILASASPRRRMLLDGMGFTFRVIPVNTEEHIPEGVTAAEASEILAREKAEAFPVTEMKDNSLLVTADTLVVLNDLILGKPAGRDEAIDMIRRLSGRTHEVITGVCLKLGVKEHCFHSVSEVRFKAIPMDEIVYYIDHYKPYDKAGAYGIQEWIGYTAVERIDGSYFNVMGLPTAMLWEELKAFIG